MLPAGGRPLTCGLVCYLVSQLGADCLGELQQAALAPGIEAADTSKRLRNLVRLGVRGRRRQRGRTKVGQQQRQEEVQHLVVARFK